MLQIRSEKPIDILAIQQVNEEAFTGSIEAHLVNSLRKSKKKYDISSCNTRGGISWPHIIFTSNNRV